MSKRQKPHHMSCLSNYENKLNLHSIILSLQLRHCLTSFVSTYELPQYRASVALNIMFCSSIISLISFGFTHFTKSMMHFPNSHTFKHMLTLSLSAKFKLSNVIMVDSLIKHSCIIYLSLTVFVCDFLARVPRNKMANRSE